MNPLYTDFKKSIKRLEEVLKMKKSDITRDSAIKRFELCFDLAWKSIKTYAKQEGLECVSPRSCIKMAFELKLIKYENKWLHMIADRNTSVHLYEQSSAELIYSHLPKYLKLFKKLEEEMVEKK